MPPKSNSKTAAKIGTEKFSLFNSVGGVVVILLTVASITGVACYKIGELQAKFHYENEIQNLQWEKKQMQNEIQTLVKEKEFLEQNRQQVTMEEFIKFMNTLSSNPIIIDEKTSTNNK